MYGTKEIALEQTIERKFGHYLHRLEGKRIRKPRHCEVCGHAGHLRWHGSYIRSLITLAQTYALPVKRLLCVHCGHTFVLLPEFVLKFHRYARAAILHAVRMLVSRTYEAVADMFAERDERRAVADMSAEQGERHIAILTLRLWRRKFA